MESTSTTNNRFAAELAADMFRLKNEGRLRLLRDIAHGPGAIAEWQGKIYRNFSSNDYMGLAGDMELRRAFYAQFPDFDSPELAQSSASSRLLTGNVPAYSRLEETLSGLYGNRAALVFNSGYHANIGILPALAGSKDLILSDKLNHASIIDGLRLAQAEFIRYRHLDFQQLHDFLAKYRSKYRRFFIVTESIFSMDGDSANLQILVQFKREFDAILVVDEAHAVGVRGPHGTGLAAEQGVMRDVDILIGTFGKALGSTGAYAIMEPEIKAFLVNHMRPLIFTTGLPPVILNWSTFILRKCAEMDARRAHLLSLANRLRARFQSRGYKTGGDSQIVPLVVGADKDACDLAQYYLDHGVLVFAIRPPTVPMGTARLRFSLSAALSDDDIDFAASL
ncbi:MAG: aminotransferase class I/II-fold pyridoxal phosphate-dependent enzyme [Kiritimatiellia bacterium]